MAKLSLLLSILILSCILLFQCCLARNVSGGQQQQRQNECQIRSINALEPTYRMQAEAGVTEFWDTYNEQFQCAGVAALRHNVQSRGLLLPSYTNAPLLVYIVQGRGIQGILLPGCPETFQSSQQSQQYEGERGERGQRFRDRHQKIEHFRQGDVLAIQAGAAHWMYNDGNEELVAVVLLDTANNANQLDRNQRRFFLAGNPQSEQQQQGQYHHRPGQLQKQFGTGNVFRGFDIETLTEAFGVDERTARRLQGQEDERGHIVRVEQGLQVIRPPFGHRGRGEYEDVDEEEPNGRDNGIEETICSARVRQNIDNPSRADVYNPRAGRFTSINSFTFPVLRYLRLSVQRGVLYRNSIFAPHWYTNCHNVIYVTRGESRIQIVDHSGRAVHDGQVREGQILIVPQNFAVVKQAGERGFEWVGFNTNDNAMINTLSGRTSAMRGLPVDVIANSYQISREEARRMKFSRDQTLIFESRYRSERVASA